MPYLQRPRISRHGQGQHPPLGSKVANGKRRALVGWTHYDDTPEGRRKGGIWCWVIGPRFLVYNAHFNRSTVPGVQRDCGMANFTMIRMNA